MTTPAEQLAEAIALTRGEMLLVVTGAGVSLASGIPTFRGTDPDAVWKRDVTELGTFRYFQEDPAGSWSWYMSRFDMVLDAEPNPAHDALVALENWQAERGRFLLVTQNVDALHAKAGSQRLVEVHGRADRIRCSATVCKHGAPRGSLPREQFDMTPPAYLKIDVDGHELKILEGAKSVLSDHVKSVIVEIDESLGVPAATEIAARLRESEF